MSLLDRTDLFKNTFPQYWKEYRRGKSAYEYMLKLTSDKFFRGGAAQKTYMLYVGGDRTSAHVATGDSNDALIRANHNNYAANDTNFIMRGINVSLTNRSGGTIGRMENSLGVQGKSGGTITNLIGLTVTPENYGTVSTLFGGIDVVMKNEGAVATTEFGIRLRNENNSLATAVGSAVLVADTGANVGWNYGLDMGGASIAKAEVRMATADAGSLPCIIASGTATDDAGIVSDVGADTLWADGSLYISVVDSAGTLWQKRNDIWTSI